MINKRTIDEIFTEKNHPRLTTPVMYFGIVNQRFISEKPYPLTSIESRYIVVNHKDAVE